MDVVRVLLAIFSRHKVSYSKLIALIESLERIHQS